MTTETAMNKSELIITLAEKNNLPADQARIIVDTMVDLMKEQLMEGGRIEIRGFGSFEMREYRAYTGRNPKTGKAVQVKPKRMPFFKCGLDLKEQLNSD